MQGDEESRLRASAVELLEMTVKHDSSLLRKHLLSQVRNNHKLIVRVFVYAMIRNRLP